MGRRLKLSLCGAALAAALLAAPAFGRSGPVEFGTAVNNGGFLVDPDPRYRATLERYDAITAESAMKILDLRPAADRWDFTVADAMVAFAEAHGQQVHGHTLTWCEDTWIPAWLRDRSWTRAQLLSQLDDYITGVLVHFHGRIASWDVVNEAFTDDGTRRNCLWSRVIGPDWVEQAFRFARRADPSARLFYNEVRAETPGPKLDAVLAMVRDFRERGVPIDGVGEQMHFVRGAPSQADMQEPMRLFGELGLDVHISELDVPVWYLGSTLDQKLSRQADSYRRIAAACQAEPACFRITTWGFADHYSWRGANSYPLPFDSEYRPKPAWTALQEVLRAPPPAPAPSAPQPSAPPAAPAAAPTAASASAAPQAPPAAAALGYRAWLQGVSARDRRHRRVQGDAHVLRLAVSPKRRIAYRVCLRGGALRKPRCFARSTSQAGVSKVDVSLLVNDRGGPGPWRVVWRVGGRRVAEWAFTVRPERI
jgi:endo-1,4-beta-xylanase